MVQKILLMLAFASGLLALLAVTIMASQERSILDNGDLMRDGWFQATLLDAYLGFLTVGLWMCYCESSWIRRGLWLISFLLLGNLAIAAYALLRLWHWAPSDGFAAFFLNHRDRDRWLNGSAKGTANGTL